MEMKNNKSAWAALATLSVTAVAAGATAYIKLRKKRRLRREAEEAAALKNEGLLSPEQQMVYNDAVRAFLFLNDRIYELRSQHKELQPIIHWLATEGEKPEINSEDERIMDLVEDINEFLITKVPFINACINIITEDGTTFADYIRAAAGQPYDPTLDVEHSGEEVKKGTIIKSVLKLGYFFPESRIATHPVKSIVLA